VGIDGSEPGCGSAFLCNAPADEEAFVAVHEVGSVTFAGFEVGGCHDFGWVISWSAKCVIESVVGWVG
jgi:hypothetical protein